MTQNYPTPADLAHRLAHWSQLERASTRAYGATDHLTLFYRARREATELLTRSLYA